MATLDVSYSWTVENDCTQYLRVISDMDTEEFYDILTVDGRKFSGKLDLNLLLKFGNLSLQFTTDRVDNKQDFIVHWACGKCPS